MFFPSSLLPSGVVLPRTSTLGLIPDGAQGTRKTLDTMRELVLHGRATLPIRSLAVDIVAHVPEKDRLGELAAVQRWVKRNIRYIGDVRDVETLHSLDVLLAQRQGDCDDQAMLVAALLESISYRTRFKALALRPGRFVHVFTEAEVLPFGWVSVETTEPVSVGWQPGGVVEVLTVEV